MNQLPESSPLSGADWFMLAMDSHMTRYKAVGNVCRYALFINGRLSEKRLRDRILEKHIFNWLSCLEIKRKFLFRLPAWEQENAGTAIQLRVYESDSDDIPGFIFDQEITIGKGPLFHIDIINKPGNKSIFIFSWHHILMDGRGAGMLLKYLNDETGVFDSSCLVPVEKDEQGFRKNWTNMMETKIFLKASSIKPLASIMKAKAGGLATAHYKVIKFNVDETKVINENAQKHGARYGKSPFYLATTTRAVHKILQKRGTGDAPFWVPVPQDERLRGASGPVITNQLSFIFYRIPVKSLSSIRNAVNEITSQMVNQVRTHIPKKYAGMMDWFRRMPLRPYYQLIKGPAGGSIASFLFSVAADSHTELRSFFGYEVEDAVNYPPNTYPPGFTVVFMRFNGTLKIIIAYVEQTISNEEVMDFETIIKRDLIEGDPVR